MVLGAGVLDEGEPGAVPDRRQGEPKTDVKGGTLHRGYAGGAAQQKAGRGAQAD